MSIESRVKALTEAQAASFTGVNEKLKNAQKLLASLPFTRDNQVENLCWVASERKLYCGTLRDKGALRETMLSSGHDRKEAVQFVDQLFEMVLSQAEAEYLNAPDEAL